ncbi:MAG: hypothetical protein HGB14_10060 [Anaerolineaceae bacterium]|nr:hypothetical protein [Anaerolineaceae bacterium]
MTEETIVIIADSLPEARRKIKSQIPEGLDLISEKVITEGGIEESNAWGETTQAAFEKAESKLPGYAEALSKTEYHESKILKIMVEAFDEAGAKTESEGVIKKSSGLLKSIRMVTPGKSGLFGMGKKPNQYEVEILQQAFVGIKYKQRAEVIFTIGKIKRSDWVLNQLAEAERNNLPVNINCDQCQAMAHPLEGNIVMVLTQDVADIASRYCDKCNMIICGKCAKSRYDGNMELQGGLCPVCYGKTVYAAIPHLRKTHTSLC